MSVQNFIALAKLMALGVCPYMIFLVWRKSRHWVCGQAAFYSFGRIEGIACVPMQNFIGLAELEALGVCPCNILLVPQK